MSCALAFAIAAGNGPEPAGAAVAVSSSVLVNGVTVVTRQRPGSRVVAIDAAIRAGSRYEADTTASATRFLESALLLGTSRWPTRDELLRSVAARGGELGVSAGREIVEVSLTVSQDDAPLAAAVLGDVLLRSLFDPEAIEREREVILQQVQERDDEPEDRASDALFTTVFAGHPLGRLPFGTVAGVEQLSADAVEGYWRERLVGPNVVVAVVSGLPHESVVALVGAALTDLPPGPVPALNYAEVTPSGTRALEIAVGTDQSHIFIACAVPGIVATDRAPLRVLNAVLGRSSGRLFREIRDRRGLAYTAYSTLTQWVDAGVFMLYAGTDPATADAVVGLLRAEAERIRSEPIGADELRRAVDGEIGSRTISLETSGGEALYLARDTVFGVPSREIQAAELRAVTVDDVRRVARLYLDPDRCTIVVTRPTGDDGAGEGRP